MPQKFDLNRDVIVALFLLLVCGAFIAASFDIKEASFGQMSSALWPRAILAPLTVLSFVYLIRALGQDGSGRTAKGGFTGWFKYYSNPIYAFILFFVFLATMPYLGMLIGGMLFVFFMLNILGGFRPEKLLLHGGIAVVFVGAMWAIFIYALGVILPQGEIFTYL